MGHITVLQTEAIDGLELTPEAVVIDATYGVGGHSREILSQLGPKGRLISIDADATAFTAHPCNDARQTPVRRNFRELPAILAELSIDTVDGVIADLGWRTDQFDGGGKGFSFSSDEPLLMTFGDPESHVFTADDVVNTWNEENLADVIYAYGEEPFARVIAKGIVAARQETAIVSAKQLADVISAALPMRALRARIHPATKTFQAIRIVVNDELGALKDLLTYGFQSLSPGGRLAVISFHSLEDRIVKNAFRGMVNDGVANRVTKKPITPSVEELKANTRSRSAKLRIIEKA